MNTLDVLSVIAKPCLALFQYGSRVYGTNSETSDYDFIAIIATKDRAIESLDFPEHNLNVTLYTLEEFKLKLAEHEISVLEAYFSKPLIISPDVVLDFHLNRPKLRAAISAKSQNSWVKAKKKYTVEKDYSPYVGLKSLFHAFRIVEFGKQIAAHERIVDYGAMNYLWSELSDQNWDWPTLELTYKTRFNKICTEFRALAPKE